MFDRVKPSEAKSMLLTNHSTEMYFDKSVDRTAAIAKLAEDNFVSIAQGAERTHRLEQSYSECERLHSDVLDALRRLSQQVERVDMHHVLETRLMLMFWLVWGMAAGFFLMMVLHRTRMRTLVSKNAVVVTTK